ncbi:MAG: hypothetical protein PCFJNLEI_00355 [Verrucomicrobiae bacterium]|nr:hypothetical protein [Verrucomicrobiae bacterium]
MPRPCCQRRVGCAPGVTYFKPAGVPLRVWDEVILTLDELEALRLADLQGQYQEVAAKRMRISRATFARIVEAARKKVAEALINGKALRIEGGVVSIQTAPARLATASGGSRRCPCPRRGGSDSTPQDFHPNNQE